MSSISTRIRSVASGLTGSGSRISTTAVVSVLIAGVGTLLRYSLQIALAQLMGTAGFGLYLTLRRWGEVMAVLPNRGHHGTAVRFLPTYVEAKEWSKYRGLRRYAIKQTLAGGVALTVPSVVVAALIWDDVRLAAILAMLTIPLWALFRMAQAILQAQHDYIPSSAIDQLAQPATFGIGLLLFWTAGLTISLSAVMIALLISVGVALILVAPLTLARSPGAPDAGAAAGPALDLSTWRPVARQFYIFQLAAVVVGSADLLILAAFASRTDVGLYGLATRIALLARVVNTGTDSIVAPRIAAAWGNRDLVALQSHVDKAIAVTFPSTIVLVALLIPFRHFVLGIVGEDFKAAGSVMIILLIGIAVQALTGPCGHVVALTDNERFNAGTMVAAAGLLAFGSLIAAPTGGMLAVAVTATAVNTFWNVVLVIFARRRLGIRCYPHLGMIGSLRRLA